MKFPLVGSLVLFSLFLAFKYLPKEMVNAILSGGCCSEDRCQDCGAQRAAPPSPHTSCRCKGTPLVASRHAAALRTPAPCSSTC